MNVEQSHASEERARGQAQREKHVVAISSLAAAVLLTAMKTVVGVMTNSLGILSEALHSALDLVAAAVTLWAVHVSGQPADRSHTYGHGKFENLSALVETALLLATSGWIIYESFERLLFRVEVEVDANLWAFLVMIVSIVVDFSRSRALARAAKKHQSQALEADALHFSTDIWSSAVVLVGLAGVWAGEAWSLPWLAKADAVAALGVALIVIGVSVQLGKRAVDDLLDSIPKHLRDSVLEAVGRVPGVEEVKQVRLRRSGAEAFADLTVTVNPAASFEKTHDIASQLEDAVRGLLPKADVVVHTEPAALVSDDLLTMVRSLAARQGLGAHGIRVYQENKRRSLELHVEVSDSLSLEEAHHQATKFERSLRETVPELARIVTHLEPAGTTTAIRRVEPFDQLYIPEAIEEYLVANQFCIDPHNVRVHWDGGELAVSFHCTLDPATAITEAHRLTEQLERHLRERMPHLGRVVIHVEPPRKKKPPTD